MPFVAIQLNTTNNVPIISPEGEEYILDAELIPSYPVVVIKENERLITDKQNGFALTKTTRILTSSRGVSYKFVDDIFDNELKENRKINDNHRVVQSWEIDQKLITAFQTYIGADGWQRDYIYYDITPSAPNGQLSYDFVEHIRYFDIVNANVRAVYDEMAKQTTEADPQIKSGKKSSGWTEGYFEIRANTLIQAQNGIGSTITNNYLVSGPGLFNVTYTIDRRGVWPFRYDYYIINTVTDKPQLTNYPIVNWDLNNYGASFRVDIEETDNTTIVSESTTETVKFATNFGIDVTVLKKLGLKFGASLERTTSSTQTRQYTLGSYQMGTVVVNFADNVIISNACLVCADPGYVTREYANNIFSIGVEPKRVQ